MPFKFPHKKIYLNVHSHITLDYYLNSISVFVLLLTEGVITKVLGPNKHNG